MHEKVRVGISCGDLHGIGLEVALKAAQELDSYNINMYGPGEAIRASADQFDVERIPTVRDLGALEESFRPGIPTGESARWAVQALEAATNDLISGKLDVLVTAPIDKNAMSKVGFSFPGHTEYLAERSGAVDHLMFLVSGNLRLGTITGHVPVREIADSITKDRIVSKLRVIHASLQQDFSIHNPKIAVLGLNPHASDGGRLGSEELEIITPALKEAQGLDIDAIGPFSADGFFGSQQNQQFDGVLAMYHDQGLIPFKTLSFGKGVNFTAGLPVVRTSPDHGTAFDIAGKGCADHGSMKSAIELGVKIHLARTAG